MISLRSYHHSRGIPLFFIARQAWSGALATIQCGTVRFENVQAVLFDKDGTLADSQNFLRSLGRRRVRLIDAQIPGVQDPLLMAFGLEGHQLNPEGLLAVGTRLENEIAAAAYVAETGRGWIEAIAIVRSQFAEADQLLKRKADSTPLFEGALEVLQALATAGVKVGILSWTRRRMCRTLLSGIN